MRSAWLILLLLVGCASPDTQAAEDVEPCELEARATWVQPELFAAIADRRWADEPEPGLPYDPAVLATPENPPRLEWVAYEDEPLTATALFIPEEAGVRLVIRPLTPVPSAGLTAFLDAFVTLDERPSIDQAIEDAWRTNSTQRPLLASVKPFGSMEALRLEQTILPFVGHEIWHLVMHDNATRYEAWEARFEPASAGLHIGGAYVSVTANGYAEAEVTLRFVDQDPVARMAEILADDGLPAPPLETSLERIIAAQETGKPVPPSMRVGDPTYARWAPMSGGWQPICELLGSWEDDAIVISGMEFAAAS